MIPTDMRAARMSGIALCIKFSFGRISSNARYDVRHLGKIHHPTPKI
jgi:hypothetical protein